MQTDVVCRVDGRVLRKLARGGLAWLEQNRERINRLNVFPVPDGDTGTNMVLTMQEACARADALGDESSVAHVTRALAHGALNGARGNSGTILSQLWQGFAEAARDVDDLDVTMIAEGCRRAVELAYRAVSVPREGTILTVAREIMEAVVASVEAGEDQPLALLRTMVSAGNRSLARTPDLLPVLKEAGVVDSGGQGLVCILEGMLQAATGQSFAPAAVEIAAHNPSPESWRQALEPDDEEGYGYDVQFRAHGIGLSVEAVRKAMEEMGWSAVVVGDSRLIKVHVHVHDPGRPLSYALAHGMEIDDVVVENMQMQYLEFVRDRAAREASHQTVNSVAVIAVAPGVGFRRLFLHELGAARVISGGQTMNPSAGDFLDAIHSLPNEHVVLLPNNVNVILTAQQAAAMASGRQVRVVPSRTLPQGISAMIAGGNHHLSATADDVAAVMSAVLSDVITAEITTATRSVQIGGVAVQEGQLIGMVEETLAVAGDDMLTVMRDVLRKAEADKRELVTLYYGSDTHRARVQALVEALQADFPGQTFEIVYGGQPLYPFIMSIE